MSGVRYTVTYKRPRSRRLHTWTIVVRRRRDRLLEALEASREVKAKVMTDPDMAGWIEYGISRHEVVS